MDVAAPFAGIPATPQGSTPLVSHAIRIDNPLDGPGWTSRQRAKRYVLSGDAHWLDGCHRAIHFERGNHQSASVRAAIDWREMQRRTGYDQDVSTGRMATFAALAGLPVTSPAVALGMGRRKGASAHTFLANEGY